MTTMEEASVWPQGNENILELEVGSTIAHRVEN